MSKRTELKIDPEFQRLCPPLSESERAALKESIESEGCRDAIVVWKGTIVDGHNRYDICRELKKPFETKSIELADRQAALLWILHNQLGRRNLSKLMASYLRGSLYNVMAGPTGNHGDRGGRTSEKIGKACGVSPTAVYNDSELAEAVDRLSPPAAEMFFAKERPMRAQHIIELAQLSEENQRLVVSKIGCGDIPSLQNAILRLRPASKCKTSHVKRCERCGTRLAPGVMTCLSCDITDEVARERLEAEESPADDRDCPPEVRERIRELSESKQSRSEVKFHCKRLLELLADYEVSKQNEEYRLLSRLRDKASRVVSLANGSKWAEAG